MKPEIAIIFAIYAVFALMEAAKTGLLRKDKQTATDGAVEAVSTVLTLGVTQPFILSTSAMMMLSVLPEYQGMLANLSYVVGFALFLIFDDLANYLYHRAAHNTPWLYPLHRAHHNGEYMSIRVVFRNNAFYYLFAPHLWGSGVLIYLGLGWTYASYLVIKLLVTIACHSDICWDKPLYRSKSLSPFMWLIERIIVTPSFHHAHHGKYASDGITHYKGNYGNLLSFWDVLFGTAKISRDFPDHYGVEHLPNTNAGEQLFWPIIKVRKRTETNTAAQGVN